MAKGLGLIVVLVTVGVSFLYGAKIAWHYGRKCTSAEAPENKKQIILGITPAVTAIYFFGFVILFNLVVDGFWTIALYALISSILLAGMTITMAMPELKRPQVADKDKDRNSST